MSKAKNKKITINKNWFYVALVIVLIALTVGAVFWGLEQKKRADLADGTAISAEERLKSHGITPLSKAEASNKQATAEDLAYILEEEKLAHDVYHVMGEKWGLRIFENIKKSERVHQSLVWAVMESRGLPDARRAEIGKFNNSELQALYDQLIAHGSQSKVEAVRVGVSVEETDIADIRRILSNLDEKDEDVRAVLENLLRGSENHLKAFQRQLDKYEK